MRSLSKVIHPGQYSPIISDYHPIEYTDFANDTVKPLELQPFESEFKQQPEPQPKLSEQPPQQTPVEPAVKTEQQSSQPKREPDNSDALAQGRLILERAFEKAQEIVQSAQRYQAEQLRQAHETIAAQSAEAKQHGYTDGYAEGLKRGKQEGSERGYEEGYEAGKRDAQAENRKTLDELGMMIEAVEKSKTKILREFQDDLIELSTSMAQAILKHELHTDEKALHSIILSALEEYRNQEWIRIYVPQDSANILLKADSSIVEALKGISDSVKVIVASDMEDGGCVIEMPDQVIDASINSQLTKLRQAISEAARKKPNH
jgi:flagellar assembly protein FliH